MDALASLVQLFTTLAALRQRLPSGSHIQGIVTHGGQATNIVPDLAEGRFGLRALTTAALDSLIDQVTTAAHGIAAATATTVDVEKVRAPYAHFRPNEHLSARFDEHIARHGIVMSPPEPGVFLGSSDIGNISTTLPSIHPFVAILDSDQSDHTPEFAVAAAGMRGREVMLAAADALGRTAIDL
ncbi:zinc-binding metallopeptidase family protein [Kibdelosporangium aridum]|uniref:M20 family metallopeptidase n=1 Tax=Kibdelosporangium aridum TaxID=2030 RepID=UPI001179A35B|nr:M20 family metallopeptidase [Kibdelosporangium aridum]